jgi:hypothetical protein
MVQLVEGLPSMCEALSSNSSAAKTVKLVPSLVLKTDKKKKKNHIYSLPFKGYYRTNVH